MKKLLLPFSLLFASGILSPGYSQAPQVAAPKDTGLVKVYVKQDPSTYKKVSQDMDILFRKYEAKTKLKKAANK